MSRLKSAGIESSIDDFGSNESNLSLLGVINATTIKMDRELLMHCDTAKGRTLYKSSCNTFKEMGFTIISEGVETQEQFDFIKSCKTDIIQGWYYSKALPLEIAVKYRVV